MCARVEAIVTRAAEADEQLPTTLLLLDVDQLSSEHQQLLNHLLRDVASRVHVLATVVQHKEKPLPLHRELADTLGVMRVELPPLARRVRDLPVVVQALVERRNAAGESQRAGVSREATQQLLNHPWTGNLQELLEFAGAVGRDAPQLP